MNPKRLLYIFVALAVSFILLILGFFAFTPKEISDFRSQDQVSVPTSEPESAECVGESCNSGEVSFSGIVKRAESSGNYTHFLETAGGENIAYLKTSDDKLSMVEGMKVVILGKVERDLSGLPLVLVTGIKFND